MASFRCLIDCTRMYTHVHACTRYTVLYCIVVNVSFMCEHTYVRLCIVKRGCCALELISLA